MGTFRISRLYAAQRRRALRFLKRDEDGGTTTIEFVLWLPIFVLILSLIIDVCLLFLAQARMFDVASDVARRTALGLYGTDAAAVTAAQNAAISGARFRGTNPTSTVTIGSDVTVRIVHDPRSIDITGVLSFIAGDTIEASVTQLREGS